jgi:two-component system, chemotaxis family, protein-glutamate methylesterase/glutaminase
LIPLLSDADKELIYKLAEELVGSCQDGAHKRNVIVDNVVRRMTVHGCDALNGYLEFAMNDRVELNELMSALTIHLTGWFRELPHYEMLDKYLRDEKKVHHGTKVDFKLLSAACSTGEEIWSFGLVLEDLRMKYDGLNYQIEGRDIDPVSVQKSARAIYDVKELEHIPRQYRKYLLYGKGKTAGLMSVKKEIRNRAVHAARSLLESDFNCRERFDIVVCRNVLIYFSEDQIAKIIQNVTKMVRPGGLLFLGHSETVDAQEFGLSLRGNSIYEKKTKKSFQLPSSLPDRAVVSEKKEKTKTTADMIMARYKNASNAKTPDSHEHHPHELKRSGNPRVLVIDDSKTICEILKGILGKGGFDVTVAYSGKEGSKILEDQSFDVITLDLHMAEQDGIAWYKKQKIKHLTTPVVVVSDSTPEKAGDVLGALEHGISDYIEKTIIRQNPKFFVSKLKNFIKSSHAPHTHNEDFLASLKIAGADIILIGASTGGTEALTALLKNMPSYTPPICIVQHISPNFAPAFSKRLAKASNLTLGGMRNGEALQPGHIYMAQESQHIKLSDGDGRPIINISTRDPVNGHRPSVDVLFKSASKMTDTRFASFLLTGMGRDGAEGMRDLHILKHMTLAQDEKSCVVYGMPKEAVDMQAVQFLGDLSQLRQQLDAIIRASVMKAA